jgi:hypothetical protein
MAKVPIWTVCGAYHSIHGTNLDWSPLAYESTGEGADTEEVYEFQGPLPLKKANAARITVILLSGHNT